MYSAIGKFHASRSIIEHLDIYKSSSNLLGFTIFNNFYTRKYIDSIQSKGRTQIFLNTLNFDMTAFIVKISNMLKYKITIVPLPYSALFYR